MQLLTPSLFLSRFHSELHALFHEPTPGTSMLIDPIPCTISLFTTLEESEFFTKLWKFTSERDIDITEYSIHWKVLQENEDGVILSKILLTILHLEN